MATITADSVSGNQEFSSSSSRTWSHTIGSGNGRLLVVGAPSSDGSPSISTVTYAGISCTRAGSEYAYSGERASIWYLADPPVGTANIVVTYTGTATYGGNGACSFFGVAGGKGAVDTDGEGAGAGLNTMNLTTGTTSGLGVHCFYKKGGTLTYPTDETYTPLLKDPNSDNDRVAMSYKIFTSSGANTMANWGASGDHAQAAAAFDSQKGRNTSVIIS